MSVKVFNLTKTYGTQNAIDNISFEVNKGEILGFLGPNGAGKTTTMKILTCFIPQTSGKAEVFGYDTEGASLEVRKHIGYLPEHNPLYKDMYVKEYLSFVADVYKISNKQKRVSEMIERVGLGIEQNKIIGTLSKGYRQRVGLAQAMMHDPSVLILDEPTSGLDPNQLVEIRRVISDLGKEKTVFFSTHIMQEVQALCDRVMIINKGKIVANDTIDALQNRVKGETIVTIELMPHGKKVDETVFKLRNVNTVKRINDTRFQISSALNEDVRPDIFKAVVEQNLTLIEMKKEVFSVEDVFQELTNK